VRPVGWPDEMSRPISPVPHHSLSGPSSQGKTMLIAATHRYRRKPCRPRPGPRPSPKSLTPTRTGLDPVQSLLDDPRRWRCKALTLHVIDKTNFNFVPRDNALNLT